MPLISKSDQLSSSPDEYSNIVDVYSRLVANVVDSKKYISLIPTENILSPLAAVPLASDLANQYFFHRNPSLEYPTRKHMCFIADMCLYALRKLFGVKYFNLSPLSGLNCMTIIISAFARRGANFYSISPSCGGHNSTSFVAHQFGLDTFHLFLDKNTLDFNFDTIEKSFSRHPPDFIYIDLSNILFPISLKKLVSYCHPNTRIYFDSSQILGLTCLPSYFNPLNEGLDLNGGSTHKTFPGPQKGIIFSGDKDIIDRIDDHAKHLVSNQHTNSIASLCITALEMIDFGSIYFAQILKNANALAKALEAYGVPVVKCNGSFTNTHQIWLDSDRMSLSPKDIVQRLIRNNILVNLVRLPTSSVGVGIRLGVTGITRLGMKEEQMMMIAELIYHALSTKVVDKWAINSIADLSTAFCKPRYCYDYFEEFDDRLKKGNYSA